VRKFFQRFWRVITFPFRLLWWLIRLPGRGFRKVDAFLSYVLTLMGIVRPKSLLKPWWITIVVIAVIAAAITPNTDPVKMSLVMGPRILLYFTSIGLGYLALVGRRKRALETQ
jgi:hypothetical protein